MKHLSAALVVFLVSALSPQAFAGETLAYSQSAYDAARSAGTPVVLHARASWCMICKKQVGVVDALMADPEFEDYTLLVIDYSSQKDVTKAFGINRQSTFIISRGDEELARSVGLTDPEKIRALFLQAAG